MNTDVVVEPWARRAGAALLLGVAYFVVASGSIELSRLTEDVAAIWPPNGLALAALLVSPASYWIPHSVATFGAVMAVNLLSGDSAAAGVGFATANLLECLLAALILRKRNVGPNILASLRNVMVFVFSAIAAAAVGASLGAASVASVYGGSYWHVWPGWWIADLLGLLIVTPLLTAWRTAPPIQRATRERVVEVMVLLTGTGTIAYSAFGGVSLPLLLWPVTLFLTVPFHIWAAIRFDKRVPMTTALLVLLGGLMGLQFGGSAIPFAETMADALFLLQAVLTLTSIEAMVLVAAMNQRRRAEAAARAAEVRLRDAIASMGDGFELYDADDRLEQYNEMSRQLLPQLADLFVAGTPYQQIVRAGLDRGVYLDAMGRAEEWVDERMRGHRQAVATYELHLADGRSLLMRERRTSDGGTVSIRSDISHLKEQEQTRLREAEGRRRREEAERLAEALREREALARGVLDTALDAYVRMDEGGRITEWNLMAERTFGWSREEVVGRQAADTIVPPNQREAHRTGLSRFLQTGVGRVVDRRIELRALHRSGREFPIELTIVALDTDRGRVFSAFIRDLTEKKQTEDQLRQVQKMEAVGQLTGGVAHDFNNLLAVIVASLDLAGEQVAESSPVSDHLNRALAAAEKGAALTQRLLAFSRQQTLQPIQLDLNHVVSGMVELLRRTLGEHIEIGARLHENLWPARADKIQVESSLLNLAINARDAMPNGGTLTLKTANVTLEADHNAHTAEIAPGDYVLLSVTDTGAGMPPDIMERAIEPFFTTKEVGKGSGLGLPTIYGFAKQSGGHLKIESQVGKGTTVTLYLPRTLTEAPVGGAEAPPEEGTHRGHDTEILVVEDNAAVRQLVLKQLRSLGYRTIEADNAATALDFLERGGAADLLFTDIVMPGGMSGVQLADRARELRPHIKVLLTSGFAEPITKGDVRHRLLAKPYRLQDLGRSVRNALSETVG